jgi:hypothetical protein
MPPHPAHVDPVFSTIDRSGRAQHYYEKDQCAVIPLLDPMTTNFSAVMSIWSARLDRSALWTCRGAERSGLYTIVADERFHARYPTATRASAQGQSISVSIAALFSLSVAPVATAREGLR